MKNSKKTSLKSYIPDLIPIIPISETVLFPKMIHPIILNYNKTISDLFVSIDDKEEEKDKLIGLLKPLEEDEFSQIGVVAKILELQQTDDQIKIVLQGLMRFKHTGVIKKDLLYVKADLLKSKNIWNQKTKILVPTVIRLYKELIGLNVNIPKEFGTMINSIKNPSQISDMVVSSMPIDNDNKQEFLEILNVEKRLRKLINLITFKIEEYKVGHEIAKKAKESMGENQKKFYLKEQMAVIRKELGEDATDDYDEVEEYKQKIIEAKLPKEVQKEALKELKRLKRVHPSSAERSVITTYLDCLTELPWAKSTENDIDINKARTVLDGDHYGLEKPKKRVLEYLAVKQLKSDSKSPILCFVGPPGTGKTSLGKSIASSLGREFVRISLGGVRDEAEIRGHRRTYVGALPGRIIQGLKRSGTNNPVFMLDEIDKIGNDFRGDPSSALLEVLDPEQNYSFSDHYLDVPFDLSRVMFITTANVLETIPPALRDRMEVIKFSGYTLIDKLNIANKFLIPKQKKAHGLKYKQINFTKKALDKIITSYTFEAGVRNLEREIANVCRGVATDVVLGELKSCSIKLSNIKKYLGNEKIPPASEIRRLLPGMSSFLFVSGNGGGMGYIEAVFFKKGMSDEEIILTGQLGNVMQESAIIALDYIRTIEDKIKMPEVEKNAIHIHIPEGSTPKDGPSAGIALFCALTSLFNNKPIKKGLAMSGEITLKGEVLPVGGVKEKVIGAHRAGLKEIILPEWNKVDLDDTPEEVVKDIKFHFVKNALQVLDIVF